MGVITRALKVAWDELNKPASYVKGDEFERFIRTSLFPNTDYDLLQKTHDYTTNKNDYIETSKEPDFKFRSRISRKVFFVEAKYRSRFYNEVLDWCKPYQLNRYQAIDIITPVYIAIGVGGQAREPDQVFLIPMKDIKYKRLFRSFLKRYQVSAAHCVTERELLTISQKQHLLCCLSSMIM